MKKNKTPSRERLDEQEKFALNKETERLDGIFFDRAKQIGAYVDDVSVYDLREMNDEQFDQLLIGIKHAHNLKIAEEKKVEAASDLSENARKLGKS